MIDALLLTVTFAVAVALLGGPAIFVVAFFLCATGCMLARGPLRARRARARAYRISDDHA